MGKGMRETCTLQGMEALSKPYREKFLLGEDIFPFLIGYIIYTSFLYLRYRCFF